MTGAPGTMTETPAEAITHEVPLEQALNRLQLDGAIFFRSEFTEAWAYASPAAGGELAQVVRPGADRLIMFHIVASGSCWVAGPDRERHWANEGDVIVLPYGDEYEMGGAASATSVPIFSLLAPPPWTSLPVLRHGDGGERTDVVCGYLHSEDPLFDPRMRAFPPVFVVRPQEPAMQWVRASIEYALAISSGTVVSDAASRRLPELLLIEMLRLHLASAPSAEHGWISALARPGARAGARVSALAAGASLDRLGARASGGGVAVAAWTSGSGPCSGCRRSATSRSGGCTSPPSCSPRPT